MSKKEGLGMSYEFFKISQVDHAHFRRKNTVWWGCRLYEVSELKNNTNMIAIGGKT